MGPLRPPGLRFSLVLLTETTEAEVLTDMYSIALASFSLLRATITTFAPFWANNFPRALPIPWDPPVMTTV